MNKRKLLLSNNPLLSGPALHERDNLGIPYREISISLIDRDPKQPRTYFDTEKLNELASSIKTYGILNPILVRVSKKPGRFDLVAGERRLKASQLAGLTTIPSILESSNSTNDRTLSMQLVENLQRSDLTPLEKANAIGILKDTFNFSIREVAEKLGISKSMVQRSLDILLLPDDLLNALKEGASESKILLLSKIEDEEIRASYLNDIDILSRDQIKKDVKKSHSPEQVKPSIDSNEILMSPEDQRLAEEMQQSLGMKVRLIRNQRDNEKGKVIVEFYSSDDLQEIFRKVVSE